MAVSETLNGYVTVRPFGEMFIPVPIQNLILRNYCTTKGFSYALPLGEHKYDGCFMQLFATVNLFENGGRIGMCSASMLPVGTAYFAKFRDEALRRKVEVHCLFEGLCLKSQVDFDKVSDLLTLRKFTDSVDHNSSALKDILRGEMTNARSINA